MSVVLVLAAIAVFAYTARRRRTRSPLIMSSEWLDAFRADEESE